MGRDYIKNGRIFFSTQWCTIAVIPIMQNITSFVLCPWRNPFTLVWKKRKIILKCLPDLKHPPPIVCVKLDGKWQHECIWQALKYSTQKATVLLPHTLTQIMAFHYHSTGLIPAHQYWGKHLLCSYIMRNVFWKYYEVLILCILWYFLYAHTFILAC